MATSKHSTRALRVDWNRAIPVLSPFAAYGLIMAIVALLAEG